MKGILYYHSMSGNTRLACERIAGRLRGRLALCDIRQSPPLSPNGFDIVGLAFPTHHLGLPHALREFLQNASDLRGKPMFLLNTYSMMPGRALLLAKELLAEKGCGITAWHALNMPEDYPPFLAKGLDAKDKPDDAQLAAFDGFIRELAGVIDKLDRKETPAASKIKLDFFSRVIAAKSREKIVKELGSFRVDEAACSRCGECAENCPCGAIRMNPLPVFNYDACVGCWACFHACGERAISTAAVSAGSRYGGPDEALREKMALVNTD